MYDEGLVRATARQILINDIKAGKIKNITVSEAINMKEPIDPFRQIYGEGALEQLDSLIPNFRNLKTEMEAEKLARSKFKFEPDENRLPGSVSIEEGRKAEQEFGINKPAKVSDFKAEATKRTSIDDLIDEYNANQDRLLLTDEEGGTLISYQEFNKLKDRNDEIAKALEAKGISSKVEEAPKAEIIPFRKKPTEPEGKADGGRIGYAYGTPAMGLDYLTGMEPSEGYANGGRIGFRGGSGKKILDLISKTKTPETLSKAGEGRFTKQQVLEKIMQNTIEANPTDEYVQKTFPNFIKEIREKPELANNENVWKTFTEGFPENKRLVVYGDDTVDFFTKGENLPEGMKQTIDLVDTYGISMKEARRIKQLEPEDQVMEIKKLQINKERTQKAKGGSAGLNYLMGL
jgi:hypothetical protein